MEITNSPSSNNQSIDKPSSLKRKLFALLILGVLAGSGYIAYDQGALNRYLPNSLKTTAETQPNPAVVSTTNEDNASVNTPSTVTNNVVNTQPALNSTPSISSNTPNSGLTPSIHDTTPTSSYAPIMIAINGTSANALLEAYDAQWQWQTVEQSFKVQGDASNALQQVQALKSQLQLNNHAAFAPSITALIKVEGQLQAWIPLQTTGYLNALQQTMNDVDAMAVNVAKDIDVAQVTTGEQSWWQKILASLKNVIEIKRVDEQKNNAALSASTAALVKQAIVARLASAQLAAQNGQWQQAQIQARAAQALATQWADEEVLNKIKPLLELASFPDSPDFTTVKAALMQARTQLVNEARAAQALPAPTAAPAPAPASTSTPNVTPEASKGGA